MFCHKLRVSLLVVSLAFFATFTAYAAELELPSVIGTTAGRLSTLDSRFMSDGLKMTEQSFRQLYRSLWRSRGMDLKLTEAVEAAVNNRLDDLLPGTKGLQILLNKGNLVEKILEDFSYKFNGSLDEMLSQLEQEFSQSYRENLVMFYRKSIAANLSINQSPMQRAFIRQSASEMTHNNSSLLLRQIEKKLSIGESSFVRSGLGIGLVTAAFSKSLGRLILKKIGSRVAGGIPGLTSAAMKKIASITSGIGTAMLIYSAGEVMLNIADLPDQLKGQFKEHLIKQYSVTAPDLFWETMRPTVEEGFKEAYRNIQDDIRTAEALAQNPVVVRLSQKLSQSDAEVFVQNIASVSRKLGVDVTDEFLEDYGELIRDTKLANQGRLIEILAGNRTQVKEWFNLLGANDYFNLYANLPKNAWDKYSPSQSSAEILQWISNRLPRYSREKALSLHASDMRWIIDSFPDRFLSDLFDEKHVAAQIHSEIARLKQIPDKESREPWLTGFSFLLRKWGIWTLIGVSCVFVLLLLAVVRPFGILGDRLSWLKRLAGRKKTSLKVLPPEPSSRSSKPMITMSVEELQKMLAEASAGSKKNAAGDMTGQLDGSNTTQDETGKASGVKSAKQNNADDAVPNDVSESAEDEQNEADKTSDSNNS